MVANVNRLISKLIKIVCGSLLMCAIVLSSANGANVDPYISDVEQLKLRVEDGVKDRIRQIVETKNGVAISDKDNKLMFVRLNEICYLLVDYRDLYFHGVARFDQGQNGWFMDIVNDNKINNSCHAIQSLINNNIVNKNDYILIIDSHDLKDVLKNSRYIVNLINGKLDYSNNQDVLTTPLSTHAIELADSKLRNGNMDAHMLLTIAVVTIEVLRQPYLQNKINEALLNNKSLKDVGISAEDDLTGWIRKRILWEQQKAAREEEERVAREEDFKRKAKKFYKLREVDPWFGGAPLVHA